TPAGKREPVCSPSWSLRVQRQPTRLAARLTCTEEVRGEASNHLVQSERVTSTTMRLASECVLCITVPVYHSVATQLSRSARQGGVGSPMGARDVAAKRAGFRAFGIRSHLGGVPTA